MHPLNFLFGLCLTIVSCIFYVFLNQVLKIPMLISFFSTVIMIYCVTSVVSRVIFKDWKFWKI